VGCVDVNGCTYRYHTYVYYYETNDGYIPEIKSALISFSPVDIKELPEELLRAMHIRGRGVKKGHLRKDKDKFVICIEKTSHNAYKEIPITYDYALLEYKKSTNTIDYNIFYDDKLIHQLALLSLKDTNEFDDLLKDFIANMQRGNAQPFSSLWVPVLFLAE
jgi:hypothetical protein